MPVWTYEEILKCREALRLLKTDSTYGEEFLASYCTGQRNAAAAIFAEWHSYQYYRPRLLSFMKVSENVDEFNIGWVRTIVWETHAHTIISKGGTFNIRALDNKSSPIEKMVIPPTQILRFEEEEEINLLRVAIFSDKVKGTSPLTPSLNPIYSFKLLRPESDL
ncbi:hypothetical protein HK098_005798 [Nowakowskiella sp. JEL0407]|nr:hypothetical protein HK098_005798 [Nowakowskiella sp. JEL0407]